MMLIDTHTHLYLTQFDEDLSNVAKRAREAGVEKLLIPDIDKEHTEKVKQIVEQFPGLMYGMTGIHPTSVDADYKEQIAHFEKEIEGGFPWIAVGEIGTDLYWDKTYFKEQEIVFRYMMETASRLHLPVSIHQRSSMQETLKIMSEFNGKVTGVLHCFSGEKDDATTAINLGYKLGISGVITFKNSNLREIVTYTGLDHIVLETDAPFLAPMPFRGKRNEPAYLKYVVTLLSQTLGVNEATIAEATTRNALQIFQKIQTT
ncbi:MAG TPA: hydrolase TatD [Bacteroidales bacterium]|nr:hydrolase TatD [Bacteroidales bacterium]HCB61688.1 hydrolase TatD [Bacteroidales bacterium]HCY22064.1 hydrolase TatD [Bacteroidales bacterium]